MTDPPNPDNPREASDGTVAMNPTEERRIRQQIEDLRTDMETADKARSAAEKVAGNTRLSESERETGRRVAEDARQQANTLAGQISLLRAQLPPRSGRA